MTARVRRSFAVCLLVLPFLILGQASPAVAAAWTWAGPDGGTVYSLALQPGSSRILYAGTLGSVFKSLDGGATWLPPSEGLPAAAAGDIAVDPARPAIVYAAMYQEGIYKSTDGGAHWTPAGAFGPGLLLSANALTVAPGGEVYAGTEAGVFRSRNGGATWQALNQGLPKLRVVSALEIDPSQPKRMYAGLGSGLFRSTDGGARWTRIGGAVVAGSTIGVLDIAVSPASPKTVYAALESGVARSFDSGATWLPPGQGLTGLSTPLISLAAHPTLPETVYAGTSEGVFRSADRGATWVRVSEGLSDPFVQALVIDPANPATLWAGTGGFPRLGGVFKTTDAGASWSFSSRGLSTLNITAVAVDPHTPDTIFAAFGNLGLARSRDRGLHWTWLPIPEFVQISDVEIDPVNPSIVYAAVSSYGGPLLKSTDGGDTWTRLGASPDALVEIEIDPANPAVLYGGGSFTGFYKSTDAGATWVRSPTVQYVTPLQIEIAPGVLYAIGKLPQFGTPGANRTEMYRSTDAGQTWQIVIESTQLPRSLAVSPSDPNTVYALLLSGIILRSTDRGDTWQQVGALTGVTSLAMSAGPPETLYAARSGQGILASTDGGATWTPVVEGFAGITFGEIFLDPQDPARLYVTTFNRGLLVIHEPEDCEPGPTTLCLQGGRFQVEAAWTDFQGNDGAGQAIPMTNETGGFWFFDSGNVELVVKVLDGRGSNGRFWVFAASLTSVEFTLTVTDTETGKQKVYHNPSGKMASFGDTDAF